MKLSNIAKASLISLVALSAVSSAQAKEPAKSALNDINSLCYRRITPPVDGWAMVSQRRRPETEIVEMYLGFADSLAENHNSVGAIERYSEIIRHDPTFARNNSKAENYFLVSSDKQKLLTEYNEILKKSPTDPYALAVRGEIKYALNDIDGAEADFNKSIAYKNDLLFSHLRLAEAVLTERSPAVSIGYCERAVSHFPKNARAHCNLGLAYEESGNHAFAIAEYDKAIELDPRFARAYFNRAVAQSKTNNFKAEFSDLILCRELEPDLQVASWFWDYEQTRQRYLLSGSYVPKQCCHHLATCSHNHESPQQDNSWPLTVLLTLSTLLASLIPKQLSKHLLFHE
ncbi:hypothetical protein BH11CYA1_BH11CYA1_50610 [soil metagenome]